MAISPWQYKDLNDGNPENTWVAYSDTLFAQRLHDLATSDFQPDIVELLTWNDFPESHYLRDLPSEDESASDYMTWADGMYNYVAGQTHAPWRIIAKYYIHWWRNGSPPGIVMDQVIYWYRLHPKDAECSGGTSVPVRNNQYPVDAVFAWALVKDAATITMNVGDNENYQFTADGSGPVMNMVPFPENFSANFTPSVSIARNGETIVKSTGSMPISQECFWQNFNPVVNLAGDGINVGP